MLDFQYNTFLGGTPPDLSLMANSAASDAPYIGCMRDVYVSEGSATDFNTVPYQTGLELGTCKSQVPDVGTEDSDADSTDTSPSQDGSDVDPNGSSAPSGSEESGSSDGSEQWINAITPEEESPAPQIYGECKLPLTPAQDEDLDQTSGLRFGE